MPTSERGYRSIDPEEAQRLLTENSIRLLDVRTPREHQALGHLPGSILLPVDWIASALATLPRDGKPLLIYCEHGIRSAAAARLLAQGGYPNLLNLKGGMSRWAGPRDFSPGKEFGEYSPSSWLVLNADLIPRQGRVLDLACGSGRNALLLAMAGFPVQAVDRDPGKIESLHRIGTDLGIALQARVQDLEATEPDLGRESAELILGFHYLHRPLFPVMIRALSPGGLLLYETFLLEQAARGRPSRPGFLLARGELSRLVEPLQIVRRREGEFEGRMVAGVAARKEAGPS
jgi:rhodanese-related sulfurtransferase